MGCSSSIPVDFTIRKARPDEADGIGELGIRSKAHWGYTAEQMRVFADELTLAREDIEAKDTHVLENGGSILGYYTLVTHTGENVELEHLFVDPDALRAGLGSALLDHACGRARNRGFLRMLIQSDPFAEGFYVSRGASVLMRLPTSVEGRTLPLMELRLGDP